MLLFVILECLYQQFIVCAVRQDGININEEDSVLWFLMVLYK